MTQPTFGLDPGGFAQPDLWQILYGMTNINPALELALQQYSSQSSLAGQLAAANASAQTGSNAAMANVYGSQIAAQGGIAQQGIQSGTAASIANAQISGDLIAAMGGDQNAAHRLQAQLGLQAGVANQDMQRRILSALSTTGLRSQSQANAWMRGFAPQPGFGSAGNYWLNSVNPIAAPQVQYSPYDLSGLTQAQAPSANFTMPPMPTFNTGGVSSGGNVGNIGGMFSDIYGQLQNTLGPMELLYGAAPAPTPPVAPIGPAPGSPEAIAATQATWEALLAAQGSGSVWGGPAAGNFGPNSPQMLHAGGKIKPGETAIVGERGPEIARGVKGGTDIIPFGKFRGGFDTGTGPHTHDEKGAAIYDTTPDVVDKDGGATPSGAILPPDWVDIGTPPPPPSGVLPPDQIDVGTPPTLPSAFDFDEWVKDRDFDPGFREWARDRDFSGRDFNSVYQGYLAALGGETPPTDAPGTNFIKPNAPYVGSSVTPAAEGAPLSHIPYSVLTNAGFFRKADGSVWFRGRDGRIPITDAQTAALLKRFPTDTPDIGVPPGEDPLAEPNGLEQPPVIDPHTGEPPVDLSTLLSQTYEGFSYDPSKDLSGTGAEALGLPGIQALLGNVPQGFPGDQTFDLPELGMTGIRGPAQSASIFRPGILTKQEIDDIAYLFELGGYDASTAAQIIQAFTPGRAGPFAGLGF